MRSELDISTTTSRVNNELYNSFQSTQLSHTNEVILSKVNRLETMLNEEHISRMNHERTIREELDIKSTSIDTYMHRSKKEIIAMVHELRADMNSSLKQIQADEDLENGEIATGKSICIYISILHEWTCMNVFHVCTYNVLYINHIYVCMLVICYPSISI